jgi:hypothetical protein
MPGYVSKALHRFNHPPPTRPQHAPHQWTTPAYGSKVQLAQLPSTAPLLDKKGTTRVQAIAGTFLYYSRVVDPTMLVALNEIASQQATPTDATLSKTKMLMDYAHTNPEATIRYHASDMCLHIDSDAAYLVQPKARSRAAGHFYLSNQPPPAPATPNPTPNGPIHTECSTIRPVMSSAAEAETGTIFLNGQRAVPMRTTLSELRHQQPPTPVKTDSATSHGILTGNMRRKNSKAFDMRFHWMKDRILQG